jgi:hypothetical protein
LPKIHAYYDHVLADVSINDITHTLHYLLKMLQDMQRVDATMPTTGQNVEQPDEESHGKAPR